MPLLMRRPRPIGRSTVGELDRSPSGVARPWSGGGKGRCDDVVMSSGGSEWCARCEILDGLEVKVGGSDGEMRPLRRRPGSGDGEGGMTRSSDRPCSSSSSASSTDDAYVAGNVRECRYGWCSSRASWSRCSASPAVLSERNELRRAVLPRPSTPLTRAADDGGSTASPDANAVSLSVEAVVGRPDAASGDGVRCAQEEKVESGSNDGERSGRKGREEAAGVTARCSSQTVACAVVEPDRDETSACAGM